jgi:hypothetical protein
VLVSAVAHGRPLLGWECCSDWKGCFAGPSALRNLRTPSVRAGGSVLPPAKQGDGLCHRLESSFRFVNAWFCGKLRLV